MASTVQPLMIPSLSRRNGSASPLRVPSGRDSLAFSTRSAPSATSSTAYCSVLFTLNPAAATPYCVQLAAPRMMVASPSRTAPDCFPVVSTIRERLPPSTSASRRRRRPSGEMAVTTAASQTVYSAAPSETLRTVGSGPASPCTSSRMSSSRAQPITTRSLLEDPHEASSPSGERTTISDPSADGLEQATPTASLIAKLSQPAMNISSAVSVLRRRSDLVEEISSRSTAR